MGKRRRSLSPEEKALWDRLRATVAPLHPVRKEVDAALDPADPAPASPDPVSLTISVKLTTVPVRAAVLAPGTDPQAPRMDRRRFDKMRRGQLKPEARLDLHGMTAARAHAALIGFISNAHSGGLRLVLVITGKGRDDVDFMSSDGARGVLRRHVPHWLATPPLAQRILQVTPAHKRHGGDGAFYVYLARSRSALP